MHPNKRCPACRKKANKDLKEAIKKAEKEGTLPSKPKSGDKCPNCGVPCFKTWHLHHSKGKIIAYWCNECNMRESDHKKSVRVISDLDN